MTRPQTAEDVFELLMLGMLSMREDMGISRTPTKDEMSAVWAWARRANDAGDEALETSLFENVLDGHMWVDWQNGSIVFRLTPEGTAYVEQMAAERAGGSIDTLMRQMDMDPEAIKDRLGKKVES